MMPNRALLAFLCGLIVWAPIPFASQRGWAALLLCALSALWLAFVLSAASDRDFKRLRACRFGLALLALPAFIGLLSSLPVLGLQAILDRYSVSYAPFASALMTFKSLAYLCLFTGVILAVKRRKHLLLVLVCVVISGVVQAVYGAFMTLSGIEYGFLTPKYAGVGNATGTFVNANHYSAYLIMTLSAAVALLVSYQSSVNSRGLRFVTQPMMLIRVAVALIVVGVLLSSSRAANVILPASVAATLLVVSVVKKQFHRRYGIFFVVFLLFDVVVVGNWFGFSEVADRIVSTELEGERRGSVQLAALGMIGWQSFIGVGPDAFDIVFSQYYQGEKPLHFSYAHNDYIQIFLEYGIIGFSALLVFVVLTLGKIVRILQNERSWRINATAVACLMCFIWLALHSLVDFNLYITNNAYTVVLFTALVWTASQFPDTSHIKRENLEV